MRKFSLAVAAAAMAVPAAIAIPTEPAQAQRYDRNGDADGDPMLCLLGGPVVDMLPEGMAHR